MVAVCAINPPSYETDIALRLRLAAAGPKTSA